MSNPYNFKTLKVNIIDNIAYLSFNRPEAMNTYDFTMSQELPECVETLAEDSNVKIIVLRGEGNIFMAGGDIGFLKHACSDNEESTIAAISSLNETVLSIQSMDKLVVAAVEGACAGAGMSIMLAADFAYCAHGTKFNTAYANLGLSPDGGMSYNLPRIIGHKKAMEMILLAKPFWAEDAYEIGIINSVLAAENFDNQIEQIVQQLTKKSPDTITSIKTLMRSTSSNNLQQQLSLELESFVNCTKTKGFQQGIEAFLSKTSAK